MNVSVFFRKKTFFKKIEDDFYKKNSIYFENRKYSFCSKTPIGFELGFYNWIILDEKIIGVNFELNTPNNQILKKVKENNYKNVLVDNKGIYLFFNKTYHKLNYTIDYCESFINLYCMYSEDGSIALTFNIPENIEYSKYTF